MKKTLIFLISLLFVTMTSWATDAPSVKVQYVAVASSATSVDVPIKVVGNAFTNIGTFSLTFSFDYASLGVPTILSRNAAFGTAGWDAFTYTTIASTYEGGKFIVSGYGPLPANIVSLNNGDVMFTIHFEKLVGKIKYLFHKHQKK